MTDEEKFKEYASKLTSEAKLVELCRKYLAKKRPESNYNPFEPPLNRQIHTVHSQVSIPQESILGNPQEKMQILAYARKDAAQNLLDQMIKDGFIKFHEERSLIDYTMRVRATVHVRENN